MTEGREVFVVQLDAITPSNTIVISSSMADVTIVDDDSKNNCDAQHIFHDIKIFISTSLLVTIFGKLSG